MSAIQTKHTLSLSLSNSPEKRTATRKGKEIELKSTVSRTIGNTIYRLFYAAKTWKLHTGIVSMVDISDTPHFTLPCLSVNT